MIFKPLIDTSVPNRLSQRHLFQMGFASSTDRLVLSGRKQREAIFLRNLKRCLQVKPIA